MAQAKTPGATPTPQNSPKPVAILSGWMTKTPPIVFGFLILFIGFSVLNHNFLTVGNWMSLFTQMGPMAMLAAGETLIILTGGIDLSSGPLVGLTGMIAAGLVTTGHVNSFLAIALMLCLGFLFGLFNGWLIGRFKMPAFMVTLAMGAIATGLTLVYSQGQSIMNLPTGFDYLGGGTIGLIPVVLFVTAGIFAMLWGILHYSSFGQSIYAIGGNRMAAFLAGIRVSRIEMLTYGIAGVFYAIGGVLESGMLSSATPSAGQDLILTPIAAVVIGGVSLSGGRGTIIGTLLGVVTLSMLVNGLDIINVSPFYQQLIYGLVILIAIVIDRVSHRA